MSKDMMLISPRYLVIFTSNVKVDIYMIGNEIQSFPKKKIGDQDHLLRLDDGRHISIITKSLVGRFVYLWIMLICLFCG